MMTNTVVNAETAMPPSHQFSDQSAADNYKLPYIASAITKTPEMYIYEGRREIVKMAILAHNMFQTFLEVFLNPEKDMSDSVKQLKGQEDLADAMKNELTSFLGKISKEKLTSKSSRTVTAMMRMANEIESIADCCYDLISCMQTRYNERIQLHPTTNEEIESFASDVTEFMQFNIENLADADLKDTDLKTAIQLEIKIDDSRNELRESSVNRIQESGDVKREMIFMDIIKNFERIGDYSLNISEAVKKTVL